MERCRHRGTVASITRSRKMNKDAERTSASRNDLAEDRTILANERTFAGWMRVALGAVALGVGSHALFSAMQPVWLPRLIATLFLLLAMMVIILAEVRACAVMERLSPHVIETAKPMNLRLFTAAISLSSLALIAAIWLGAS